MTAYHYAFAGAGQLSTLQLESKAKAADKSVPPTRTMEIVGQTVSHYRVLSNLGNSSRAGASAATRRKYICSFLWG